MTMYQTALEGKMLLEQEKERYNQSFKVKKERISKHQISDLPDNVQENLNFSPSSSTFKASKSKKKEIERMEELIKTMEQSQVQFTLDKQELTKKLEQVTSEKNSLEATLQETLLKNQDLEFKLKEMQDKYRSSLVRQFSGGQTCLLSASPFPWK